MKPLFTIFAISFLVIFLNININAQIGHWENLNPLHHPAARAEHGIAKIGYKKVLLFGGIGFDSVMNDTWIFDLIKNDWKQIPCKNQPSARLGFGMCQIDNNKVLLFGGMDKEDNFSNDLWIFDNDSLNWKELTPNGDEGQYFPKPVYRLGMARFGDSAAIIYGGLDENIQNVGDTWIYHYNTNSWELNYNEIPSPRSDHMMTDIDSNLIFMVGGNNGALLHNWIFRDPQYHWEDIYYLQENLSCEYIVSSGMCKLNKGLALLFGGENACINNNINWLDSTWVFNYNNKTWTKIETTYHPSDRLRPRMAYIDTNKAIMFGGGSKTNDNPYDTWMFVLDSVQTSIEEAEKPLSRDQIINLSVHSNILRATIKTTEANFNISIYNLNGEEILRSSDFKVSEVFPNFESLMRNAEVSLSNLSSSVYFLVVKTGKQVLTEKFVFVKE
jgi:N-acetylneuraminic acid mutarotase